MSLTGREREPAGTKCVLLGNSNVGKSCLAARFVYDQFDTKSLATIGAAYMSKSISIDNKETKFNIWDTAGAEIFSTLAPLYYRGAQAAIIVYDITDEKSFVEGVKRWVGELDKQGPPGIIIVLAGNKSDLSARRRVATEDARAYADEIGAYFTECSALLDANVTEMFKEIGKRLTKLDDDGGEANENDGLTRKSWTFKEETSPNKKGIKFCRRFCCSCCCSGKRKGNKCLI